MASPEHEVAFQTPLPGDAPAQRELAEIIREALAMLPGPWKVGVTSSAPRPESVIITAYRDDGFECTVFVDGPLQRTFLYVRDQVVNALQLHVLGIPRPPAGLPKLPN
jgi:hypothetical protein